MLSFLVFMVRCTVPELYSLGSTSRPIPANVPGHRVWPRRAVESKPPLRRELFPIPRPAFIEDSSGCSRDAQRRRALYLPAYASVCGAIESLNHFHGCVSEASSALSVSAEHEEVHRYLFSRINLFISHGLPFSPREAAKELLGATPSDGYHAESLTTVEPYDPSKVSLPDGQVSPVNLLSILSETLQKALTLENMLVDDDVAEWRRENLEKVTPYKDRVLASSPEAYSSFVERLYRCGLVGFSRKSRGRIILFFRD